MPAAFAPIFCILLLSKILGHHIVNQIADALSAVFAHEECSGVFIKEFLIWLNAFPDDSSYFCFAKTIYLGI